MQINVSKKDHDTIVKTINAAFPFGLVRAYMSLINPSLEIFIKAHESELTPKVVYIDSKDDMAEAAARRNSGKPTLFVFTENMHPEYYITSCANKITLPEALRLRVYDAWRDAGGM